ncbi:BglG family transcription antiterminator [Thalassobacillus pellis]|uniref:BglG family transcription antiterminator n=1 Tax=Thalassobacillus pellis TaxID=748008 RepID=UPI0019621AB9|nr:BglG family transcription antiterminator [Thalassobacillus pellis]MBM7551595.1 activator of the mannose operon (transcriptional antiterminator) [Thalassobacillus pellis]
MNDRQKDLIRKLALETNGFLQVNDLAEELDCSEKTVRNDLKVIEDYIQSFTSSSLIRKPGIGVSLSISSEEKSRLFDSLYQAETKSPEDRLIELTYLLLVSSKPYSLNDLAKRYYTNKTTIKNDLQQISRWLEKFGLELVSRQRLGHLIEGEELQKRNALARLPEIASSAAESNQEILNLFSAYEVKLVREFLEDMQHHFSIIKSESEFDGLLIHALIMITRTSQRASVSVRTPEEESVSKTEEYGIAAWFLKRLEKALRLKFPEEEHIYFTWHLISTSINHSGTWPDKVARQVVSLLVSRMKQLTMVDFSMDQILLDGLYTHLGPSISRLRYGFTIHNPMTAEIKKMYPYMFSMVMLALEQVKEEYELIFPEEEAAYLVLHFQASVERVQGKRDTAKKVLVVCNLGVGMSHLLQAKLEQSYKGFDIIDCVGEWEVEDVLEEKSADLIISTKELPGISVPLLVVSPLLEERDKKQLDEFLQTMETESKHKRSLLPSSLDEKFIFLNVEKVHRFEVVELLAKSLVNAGKVTPSFLHGALVRERSAATSIGGGIAIPHAQSEEVRHSVIAVATLASPLEWGGEMVSVVFLLAIAKEDQSHMKGIMQTISGFADSPGLVEKLSMAKNVTQVSDLLC